LPQRRRCRSLAASTRRDETPVSTLQSDLLSVPATSGLSGLMDALLKCHQHTAVVVAEFGEMRDVVTLEDLVETLIGEEIMDEGGLRVRSEDWRHALRSTEFPLAPRS